MDAAQSCEDKIVVLDLNYCKRSGPGFVSGRRRLNVALSGHNECLLIIGDKQTLGREEEPEGHEDVPRGREGQIGDNSSYPERAFYDVLHSMDSRGRIVDAHVQREGDRRARLDEWIA
ncbi:hypothetical protein PG991_013101 [Apiospora marii]|uniref:DNA2/NAM7 helicase-like C-terminal domain-containing protein n=1 Tax=Apiospora marii TaxID=335849 RepID=A0ABR1R528_9PEZI